MYSYRFPVSGGLNEHLPVVPVRHNHVQRGTYTHHLARVFSGCVLKPFMKVWRVIADVLPGAGGVYSMPLCVVIQFSGVCGKIPRFQVKRTIGERQQIAGRLAHWFGNNF